MIDFGETYSSANYLVKDTAGALAAAGTVTVTITLPDQTTAAPTVNNTALGTYSFDYLTTAAGRNDVVVTATGGTLGTLDRRWTDSFTFASSGAGFVLSMAEARAHLNLSDTNDDEELRSWLETVTRVVESQVGDIVPKTIGPERQRGGRSLWLRRRPVISVTSIDPWLNFGTSYPTTDVRVTESGRVELKTGGYFVGGPFAVVYQVGRTTVGGNIRDAGKMILQHLWESQRGASGLPFAAADDTGLIPGFAFAVPNRASELLAPDARAMNLA
jgi:hypothetical protein